MLNIGILTSSRADFGIYEPLLKAMLNNSKINAKLIVFGTHMTELYGYSVRHIEKYSIPIIASFETAPANDSPSAITESMILTMQLMLPVWKENKFDLLIALGDRYEMFAAVASTVPFNIRIAHIHGGETTLGAIDNALRHSISLMSSIHFTASEDYKKRVIELIGTDKSVYNTGALSVDNLVSMEFMQLDEIRKEFNLDLSKRSFLITMHPETIDYHSNENYANELIRALQSYPDIQQIVTMPNADTNGLIIRRLLQKYASECNNVILNENLGSRGYLSVMKYCDVIIGNSSSGFIEAAWFPKWVVNIGNRQKGRIRTKNIIDVPFSNHDIETAINHAIKNKVPKVEKIYGEGHAAINIINYISDEFGIN